MGLYAAEDDQPKLSITLFGSLIFDGTQSGIGGAISYRFTPRLELEGEVYTIFWEDTHYGFSQGLICNFHTEHNKIMPYALVGISQLRDTGEMIYNVMFGGGVKIPLTRSFKIRPEIRLHLYGEGIWTKLSIGLLWSF